MLGKHTLPRTLFTILIGIALLTAAVLVRDGLASASMSVRAEEQSASPNTQSPIPNPQPFGQAQGRPPTSNLQSPTSNLQPPTSNLQPPTSNLQSPTSSRTVAYTYDDAGRLVAVDYGGGKIIVYTYDDAGNLLQHCTLTVDFNPDRTVNVADIMLAANRWRCRSGDACYHADYDLDNDGDIDIVDIMLVVIHWGDTCG